MTVGRKMLHRGRNAIRRIFGRQGHDPFTFNGKTYDGNEYMLVPDPSDIPPQDVAHLEWRQDVMVVPRKDADRHVSERARWVRDARKRISLGA